MMPALHFVDSFDQVDRATFDNEIRPAGKPVILKGIAAKWPAVLAARSSLQVLGDYLRRRDSGRPVPVAVCPRHEKGRYFYNSDLTGVNYDTHNSPLSLVVNWCLEMAGKGDGESVYIQAQAIDHVAPAMAPDLAMPLLDASVRPRLWIGNSLTTQTHFDYDANIAVHVAGDKVFTLFAPEQTGNLYPGPLDRTPAGVPISMASIDEPDFARYPRLAQALETALTARLEPGDGLFIPPLWWHHVKTTGPLNMLINYWWAEGRADLADPVAALSVAALAYKAMPEAQRRAWRELLDYFVFEDKGDPVAHLPEGVQGVFQRNLSPQTLAQFKARLLRE